ncbi:MAG: hypothetical protein CMM47_02450 [Rhodospirillaceae bacterium]|nr:hypothetical protein [Rhodospirillaceae bacterium]
MVTKTLADFILSPIETPDEVRRAGLRSFVNIIGCMLGGIKHPTSQIAYEVNNEFCRHRTGDDPRPARKN